MSWDIIITTCVSSAIPGVFYIVKRFMSLETKIHEKLSEEQTRKLISDKVDPMKEDLIEIRARLDHILDYIIRK